MSETPQPAGVPLRDHVVSFDVTPDEALAACRSHRVRMVQTVGGLGPDDWTRPSRCSEWTAHAVVRHLVHVNQMLLEAIGAARRGERFLGFAPDRFSPKQTPLELMAAEGEQPVEATVHAYEATTREVLAELDDLPADPAELKVATSIGRQPWDRALLHPTFDSAVHERDILQPLGRRPAAPAEEVAAVAAYQVLVVARILAMVGAPVDLALRLDGGPDLRVRVDGAVVSVGRGPLDGAATEARGDVNEVLDAMVGRGDLGAVLQAPPEVVLGLSALSTLV